MNVRQRGELTRERMVGFIREFRERRRYSPSIREIADGLGHHTTSSVVRHLEYLSDAGVLTYVPGESRTVVLAEEWS